MTGRWCALAFRWRPDLILAAMFVGADPLAEGPPVSPAVGQALELIRPAGGVALDDDERRWNRKVMEARVMASTALVPKSMQGRPEVVFAAFTICEAYGADYRLAVNQVHYMNGELVPSAQLRAGVATRAGYELSFDPHHGGHLSDQQATLAIRRPGRRWTTFTVTHATAVRSGKFDEWVENWPDGGRKQTWKLRRDGEAVPHDRPEPSWVEKEVAAGKVKRFDGWWDYEEDMLASAVTRKAIRRYASDAMLGMESVGASRAFDLEIDPDDIADDDDDIVDGEIVDDFTAGSAASGETPAGSPTGFSTQGDPAGPSPRPPGVPARPEDAASDFEKQSLIMHIDALTDPERAELRALAVAEQIPNVTGARLTHAHAIRVLTLIGQVRSKARPASSPAGGPKAPVETPMSAGAADGEGGSSQTPSPPVPPDPAWKPGEEPFE